MEYTEAIAIIESVLGNIGSDITRNDYDGLIVKKLEASNTLDEGRSSNQTHIAITSGQMDFFPYVRADGYFEVEYDKQDANLKKYFIAQIPIYLHKENVTYLDEKTKLFDGDEQLVHVSIVRSRRNNAADQIQMSMTNIDSPIFVSYRKLVHAKTYIILLKRKQKLLYDLYSVKEADGDSYLKDLNNEFYKLPTNTPVKLDDILMEGEVEKERELLPFVNSKECARRIVDSIYAIDSFSRIKDVLKVNESTIKINTDSMGGNYLRFMFVKPASALFDAEKEGKVRVFADKDYAILFDGVSEKCRLSTEWVSTELGSNGSSANYLRALISVVNKTYSDVLRIYEESGKWYLERLDQMFTLEKCHKIFQNPFAKRFITSLLAKPFVILTGNSGTGKTRIAKQFAEYLEVEDENGDKNWLIVPVGADWTDNAKILGFYNPLAKNGTGNYEKTGILKLIEVANVNPDKPYFIILDEMNLSHVERYFSDFLSHMETPDSPFKMDGYEERELKYPDNLFIVGTVNIDETTYMFSPKVLDRANVVEFKPDKEDVLALFGTPVFGSKVTPANDGTAEAFLRLAREIRTGKCEIGNAEAMDKIKKIFADVYDAVEKKDFEFAFRTVREIRQYIAASYEISGKDEGFNLNQAIDEQILQKIMPKIHGNRKEIGELLDKLEKICNDNGFALSEKKIKQMKGKLDSVQYASFI